jgi:hypothetical protein
MADLTDHALNGQHRILEYNELTAVISQWKESFPSTFDCRSTKGCKEPASHFVRGVPFCSKHRAEVRSGSMRPKLSVRRLQKLRFQHADACRGARPSQHPKVNNAHPPQRMKTAGGSTVLSPTGLTSPECRPPFAALVAGDMTARCPPPWHAGPMALRESLLSRGLSRLTRQARRVDDVNEESDERDYGGL